MGLPECLSINIDVHLGKYLLFLLELARIIWEKRKTQEGGGYGDSGQWGVQYVYADKKGVGDGVTIMPLFIPHRCPKCFESVTLIKPRSLVHI